MCLSYLCDGLRNPSLGVRPELDIEHLFVLLCICSRDLGLACDTAQGRDGEQPGLLVRRGADNAVLHEAGAAVLKLVEDACLLVLR